MCLCVLGAAGGLGWKVLIIVGVWVSGGVLLQSVKFKTRVDVHITYSMHAKWTRLLSRCTLSVFMYC